MINMKRIEINYDEAIDLIDLIKDTCVHIHLRPRKRYEPFKQDCFIEETAKEIKFSLWKGIKPCMYIYKKTDARNPLYNPE